MNDRVTFFCLSVIRFSFLLACFFWGGGRRDKHTAILPIPEKEKKIKTDFLPPLKCQILRISSTQASYFPSVKLRISAFEGFRQNCPVKQECIPVGCVPSPAVVIWGVCWEGCLTGGCLLGVSVQGGCLPGGCPSQCMMGYIPSPVNRIT